MIKKDLLSLYNSMLRIRLTEEIIADNYYNDIREMHTPIHLCDGEEAIAVGVCSNLDREDMIFSNHRCHGHYLAKGGDLNALIAELHSKETGCCKGKGGSMHLCNLSQGIMLTSAIVAGNVSIATGYALAQKIKKHNCVSVVFFGDGASEEGSVYESICYAVKMKLPILFVCENNRVAISTPFEIREPKDYVKNKFESIIHTVAIDGNDVEEIQKISEELIAKVRKGEGPCLIECETFRLRAHSNIGDGVDNIYRSKEDVEEAKKSDPLVRSYARIIEQNIANDAELEKMKWLIREEVRTAFDLAKKANLVETNELYTDVYDDGGMNE